MAQMADVLGYQKDNKKLKTQADQVRRAINKYLYDPGKGEYIGDIPYDDYVPVLNVCALDYGIVPEADIKKVENRLIRDITVDKENHLYGGIFAVHSAYEYLPKNGYADLTFDLITEPSWPSFGWMVGEGATTLWEGFNRKSSDIHHFMGAVDNFFYRHLAGINFDVSSPGFRNIILRPNFIKDLDHAEASYLSIQGEIKASWVQESTGNFEYRVSLPPNCTGYIFLPDLEKELKPGEHVFKVEL